MSSSAVADFYGGKNVFITGGTGFLGIALIEKILRSTPKVSTDQTIICRCFNFNLILRFLCEDRDSVI